MKNPTNDPQFLENLVVFLNSDQHEFKMPMIPIHQINDLLKELGCKNLELWDTNGWEVDFWEYYTYNDQKIQLHGSLWSGNFSLTRP